MSDTSPAPEVPADLILTDVDYAQIEARALAGLAVLNSVPGLFRFEPMEQTPEGAWFLASLRTPGAWRVAALRAALAVERARGWEARGLAWTGDLSVSAAATEAELSWLAAICHLIG